jgi:pectinesterase
MIRICLSPHVLRKPPPLLMHLFYLLAIWALGLVHYAFAFQRGSPPPGSLTVGTKLGTYRTISAAVAAASTGDSIFVYAGTYTEAVYITVDHLTIYGQTDKCVSFAWTGNYTVFAHLPC